MKIIWQTALVFLTLCCFFVNKPFAGTLSEDYNALVSQRMELEEIRKQHENRFSVLSAQKKSLTLVFFQCVSRNDREFWESKMAEAEAGIAKLEAEKKKLVDLIEQTATVRRDLEKKRVDIENRHSSKAPGTPYETEFREYMKSLETEYFTLLKNDLFTGYVAYLSHLEDYNSFLRDAVGRCMKRKTGGSGTGRGKSGE